MTTIIISHTIFKVLIEYSCLDISRELFFLYIAVSEHSSFLMESFWNKINGISARIVELFIGFDKVLRTQKNFNLGVNSMRQSRRTFMHICLYNTYRNR